MREGFRHCRKGRNILQTIGSQARQKKMSLFQRRIAGRDLTARFQGLLIRLKATIRRHGDELQLHARLIAPQCQIPSHAGHRCEAARASFIPSWATPRLYLRH